MKALDVAKYIINKCIEKGKPISNLQLQKITYFVHLGFLRETHRKLIDDESFKAWQYGPVIKSVYNKFRIYGGFTIDDIQECHIELKPEEEKSIDKILDECIKLKPWELVQRSHNPDGAWIKVYKDGEDYKDIAIPDNLIQEEALGY
ncbi:hypothetical protein BKH42_04660 [Helicobacter sp. 13S00482-2]|uniref:Panacea domain-containing protein n=1 Tax=Helicobacter sp. 13S00482-2 TaxID=1476200 RepID=UPI000BA51A22|nr:type II toxin-antitoxin system antitoxin SocA domain-containing protein [Helicobacter sp. 13S00482-2]PAF53616.1 hypothetical protein BKH42_04660 [Helicobacter sp. 13S00482-2]